MADDQPPVPDSIPPPEEPLASEPVAAAPDAPPEADAAAGLGAAVDLAALSEQPDVEALLKQANFDDVSPTDVPGAAVPNAAPFELANLEQVMRDAQASSIELLRDVELNVKIELGRSRMLVEDVLKLTEGSVVELDKLAGDPVDVFVNDRLVARGEVLVLNDNFCVRVNEIVAGMKDEGL
jgi:flagellar motor switch protein FliN/FliY